MNTVEINPELVRAFSTLRHITRFNHKSLPTHAYCDNVGGHVVRVDSRIRQLGEKYPRPNSIDWSFARSIATHHDEPEQFFGDPVVFLGVSDNLNSQIQRAGERLGWTPKLTQEIIEYEDTRAVLAGKKSLRVCRPEHIIVAVKDLIDGADVFHLESVRGMRRDEYTRYYPLPSAALVYAPKTLIRYKCRIPMVCRDKQFASFIQQEVDGMLSAISGWWSVVSSKEIPSRMKETLRIVDRQVIPRTLRPWAT